MKALSVKQPWAWLIAKGYKDIENRSWPTTYRGRIYIHASQSESDINSEVYSRIYHNLNTEQAHYFLNNPMNLVLGAIIGEVDIVDCVTASDSPWFEGKYGFVLANPVLYDKPIPYRGRLGFFEVTL